MADKGKHTMKKARLGLAAAAVAFGLTVFAAAPAVASGYVSVPSNYVYNPNASDKTVHDYCSYSPDSWGKANFRGPCARHDMCIEFKQKARSACDSDLFANLRANCSYAYGFPYVSRARCWEVAAVYYAVVSVKTHL